MPDIKNIVTEEVIAVSENPRFIGGIWECGDQRFTDPDGTCYEPLPVPSTVDAITFKLLFTSAERVKAKELRANDPEIDDFWLILDDPRTVNVVMALPSIQSAIERTLTQINANGITIDVQARKTAILSGQLT